MTGPAKLLGWALQPYSLERLLALLGATASGLIVIWCCHYARYGIDFTDESLYLVWAAKPETYKYSVSQFGFFYQPLYAMLGGDVGALRQANILLIFGLAWLMCFVLMRATVAGEQQPSEGRSFSLISISAILASTSLLVFQEWIPAPSYNSLALQALMVCVTGLILADARPTRASMAGWVLIGVGGWLALMAKPSTAAALAVLAAAYLFCARKVGIKLLAMACALAGALTVITAFTIDGSLSVFVTRLSKGIELATALEPGYALDALIRLDTIDLSANQTALMMQVGVFAVGTSALMFSGHAIARGIAFIASICLIALSIAFVMGTVTFTDTLGIFQGATMLGLLPAAIVSGCVSQKKDWWIALMRERIALVIFLFLTPYIFAFGTNGNYWRLGSLAGIFWVLAALVLAIPQRMGGRAFSLAIPIALVGQILTVLLLSFGFEHPYRQDQPLRLNTSGTRVGPPGSLLWLSQPFSSYISTASRTARANGFIPGTPIIDLSGQSPGLLFAIEAENLGQAWMIGGYPGSEALAVRSLADTPCERIALAWVLLEPSGSRSLSPAVLAPFGARLPDDYVEAGTWMAPAGAGGRQSASAQRLVKPARDPQAAARACEAARAGPAP